MTPAIRYGTRGRSTIVCCDLNTGHIRWVPAGVAYQVRCAANVRIRSCWATYHVVGVGTVGPR